jgi:hypothetical protein
MNGHMMMKGGEEEEQGRNDGDGVRDRDYCLQMGRQDDGNIHSGSARSRLLLDHVIWISILLFSNTYMLTVRPIRGLSAWEPLAFVSRLLTSTIPCHFAGVETSRAFNRNGQVKIILIFCFKMSMTHHRMRWCGMRLIDHTLWKYSAKCK